jgi:endothelin-converting enzyme/putative endopeptidase
VRGEAIGDMAGLRIAYLALQRSIRRKPVPAVNGFSAEQQFFIALAQHRGAAESLELQRQLVKTDTHAVAKYRVIGPLSNAPEFQQAFACPPASPMVRPPEARCNVW